MQEQNEVLTSQLPQHCGTFPGGLWHFGEEKKEEGMEESRKH